jgi:hypothetical protein
MSAHPTTAVTRRSGGASPAIVLVVLALGGLLVFAMAR